MSQALPFISTGLQAGMGMFDGLSQASALRGEAKVDEENARVELLQGAIDSEDIRRRARAVQGEAISASAENAAGGDLGTSARDLIYQNALEAEYAKANARYGAALRSRGDLMQAAQARKAAKSAVIGGILRAGAAAVSGASSAINNQRLNNALFPGGQRLPMPSSGGFAQTYPHGTVPPSLPDYRRAY